MTRNNEHGFPQLYDEGGIPTCSHCGAVAEVNRGQGMECQSCINIDNEFMEDCRNTGIEWDGI